MLSAGLASLPFVLFPQVAQVVGERTVIFAMLFLFVAATALLVPESSIHVLDRLPIVASTVVLSGLLLIAVGDVCLSIWTARAMDSELSARARIVAEQRVRGESDVALPPLEHSGSRTILWGEPTNNPHDWLNEALAAYYGVESIVTTSTVPVR